MRASSFPAKGRRLTRDAAFLDARPLKPPASDARVPRVSPRTSREKHQEHLRDDRDRPRTRSRRAGRAGRCRHSKGRPRSGAFRSPRRRPRPRPRPRSRARHARDARPLLRAPRRRQLQRLLRHPRPRGAHRHPGEGWFASFPSLSRRASRPSHPDHTTSCASRGDFLPPPSSRARNHRTSRPSPPDRCALAPTARLES